MYYITAVTWFVSTLMLNLWLILQFKRLLISAFYFSNKLPNVNYNYWDEFIAVGYFAMNLTIAFEYCHLSNDSPSIFDHLHSNMSIDHSVPHLCNFFHNFSRHFYATLSIDHAVSHLCNYSHIFSDHFYTTLHLNRAVSHLCN